MSGYEELLHSLTSDARKQADKLVVVPGAGELPLTPKPAAEPEWFCIVSPNNGDHPFVMRFRDPSRLAGYILELDQQDMYVFPVFGYLGMISEGPFRYFKTHEDDVYPLFSPPGTDLQVDVSALTSQVDFYLGTIDEPFGLPPAIPEPEDEEDLEGLTLSDE